MKTPTYSLRELQILLSQILHDLISPFSTLSAGLDIPLKDQDDIWKFMQEAKKRLRIQLVLFRFIFSDGERTMKEAMDIIEDYADLLGIEVQGCAEVPPKLLVAIGFWLFRQRRTQGTLILQGTQFNLSAATISLEISTEDRILQGESLCSSPQESYAVYLFHLLAHYHRRVQIRRSTGEFSLKVFPLNQDG